jgi:hypothetical protein
MAVSGTVSTTTFNTRKVIDTAFRMCRLMAQNITSEMQDYARDALYLRLSNLANPKPPSWCIEKIILPMYQSQPVVTLPTGTVEVLNVNYRTLQELTGETTSTDTAYTVYFDSATQVATVGMLWAGTSVPVNFQVSSDLLTWTTVGGQETSVSAGVWTWFDVSAQQAYPYFRVTSSDPMILSQVYLGNMPQEIPLGALNRDTYSAQSDKIFTGRPATYWFQRTQPLPVLNLWPAPNPAATVAQLVIWRHVHIMDVGTLAQSINVPQRWLDAITLDLAARMALETPAVDPQMIPMLDAKASTAMKEAWEGDNDGSPTFYQPQIGCYTK